MKKIVPMQEERLFTPFVDAVDGTLCLSAGAGAAQIRAFAGVHRLRFPLLLDEAAPLSVQVAAATHAPASCRFGPYCDNVLGMNWRLPSGRMVRVGERVVKTTTGYDWLRFLLHTGRRFGEPVDYVLRLRPDCGFDGIVRFDGDLEALRVCVSRLLIGGWMHWLDAVDFVVEGAVAFVRVALHCPPAEVRIFEEYFVRVAAETRTRCVLRPGATSACDGLPDVVVKTTPERVAGMACLLARSAARCVALCYSGVVHVYLAGGEDLAERAHALMQPHLADVHALGGDWHSRHLPATPPGVTESQWIETLERSLHAS